MAKLDLSRDYYGDLELSPTSSGVEIKKQYKKLALVYHPDRNVGSNNLDTTKFQRIQAAYEILIDPLERAKYDANRLVEPFTNLPGRRTKTNTKGNPWSNVGKDYPPPPKPRYRPAPPPSNGARRYERFTTPQQSAYQASQEGSQARKATYDAWENMRSRGGGKTEPSSGKSRVTPEPPPRDATHTTRKEKKSVPPVRTQATDSRVDGDSENNSRSGSTPSYRKKGFRPSTPGGDELPAPRGHYFMMRKADPPPIPSRNSKSPTSQLGGSYPKINFNMDSRSQFEPRMRTPYATHGGERFDPFEAPTANIGRSKSTNVSHPKSTSKDNLFYSEAKKDSKTYASQKSSSYFRCSASKTKPSNRSSNDSSDSSDSDSTQSNMSYGIRSLPKYNRDKTPAMSSRKHTIKIPQMRPPSNGSEDSSSTDPSVIDLSSRPEKADSAHRKQSNIFSFILKDDTFTETDQIREEQRVGNSTENISTKFSAEEWNGKFSAGSNSDYFKPNSYASTKASHHSQNGTRAKTRSPTKSQSSGAKRVGKTDSNTEAPNRKKFTPEEWAETFQPQIFMSPSVQPAVARSRTNTSGGRKRTSPSTFPTNSANITSEAHRTNLDNKQSQHTQVTDPLISNVATPEPMDIDTPSIAPNPVISKSKDSSHDQLESQKFQASQSTASLAANEVQATALKVNFSDLQIKDIIIDFPLPPKPPILLQEKKPSDISYYECEMTFQHYMAEWDQFENKYLLHLVARKNNYASLGEQRWKGQENETYRNTIREDQIVLRNWAEAKEAHETAIKSWIIFQDVSKAFESE